MLHRLSRRQQAGIAVALALLMWLPSGISSNETTMVTGHSTFYNGTAYDPCMASVAGIIRSRVMWFNDQVLAERYAGKGAYIFLTEEGADDPTQKNVLYTDGVFYDFVDPNGAHWHVDELYYYDELVNSGVTVGDVANYNPGDNDLYDYYLQTNKTYVWAVEVAATPIHDQFAGNDPRYFHDVYNFLLMVDTCKFHRDLVFDGLEVHDTTEELDTERGHPAGATAHDHETWRVNLWVGKRPTIAPQGASADGLMWESSWAAHQASPQTGAAADTTRENYTTMRDEYKP